MTAIVEDYRPSDDEPYMNQAQLEYFKAKLLAWKQDILDGSRETISAMQDDAAPIPDLVDRASSEADRALELRTRDRQRKLISKIDSALRRIESNEYGYCEETGEPIGLKRLEARPTATLSLEAQERHERKERTVRDD
ncbi:MAG: RNA polymerase-binding protein DksA [Pseudomonadota bacterium]